MKSQDMTVRALVGKIERGDIRLPEMQRQYVWKPKDVRKLLDSLYRDYPSGTILTWETDEKVTTRDFAIDQEMDQGDSWQRSFELLLDGQQRLTALSAILLGKNLYIGGRERSIDIFFNLNHPEDLEEITEVVEGGKDDIDADPDGNSTDVPRDDVQKRFERMAFVARSSRLAQMAHWVSVTEVFKEDSSYRTLTKAGITPENTEHEQYHLFSKRLDQLRDVPKYKYRVHTLERSMSYEEVTEIFVRVNSLGAKLRSSDLAMAQITAKWEGALEIFEKFGKECKNQNFELEQAIHLKNLVAFAKPGQSRYKTIGSLSKEQLESKWEEAKEGMNYAMGFLRDNVGINSPALLSSPFILITLAAYAHSKNNDWSPKERDQLTYWILTANLKARYSKGSTETFLDQDLTAIKNRQGVNGLLQNLKRQVSNLMVSPSELENGTTRGPHFKTMFMAFKKDEAEDWHNQQVIGLEKSGSQYKLQFHHIFPRSVLRNRDLASKKINDICNLAFISAGTNRRINNQEPADYLPGIKDKIGSDGLAKQCIPDDPSLWKIEEYENFLNRRRELIAERLNEFLDHDRWQEGNSD